MNTTTTMVNKLLSFIGKPPISIPDPVKADADRELLNSFLSCVEAEAHKQEVTDKPDNTQMKVDHADLRSLKTLRNEAQYYLDDWLSSKGSRDLEQFYLKHIQGCLKKMGDTINRFNI